MDGMGPNPEDRAASRAAPGRGGQLDGRSRPQVGTPASRPTTAGAGLGSMPWAARTMPVPVATALDPDLVDAQHLEGGRRAHHVDDGVVPAHLVEVDLVDRPAVEAGLDLGERRRRWPAPAAATRVGRRASSTSPTMWA